MSLDSFLSLLPQTLVNAVTLGCIYCLVSLGFNMVYGAFRQLFFVISEILMLGAFVFYWCSFFGTPYILSIFISMGICAGVGVVLEKIFYSRVRGKTLESMLISLGLNIVVHNTIFLLWGQTTQIYKVAFPWYFPISVLGIALNSTRLFIILFTISMLILLQFFIKRTYYGKAIRATGQDTDVASILGINVNIIAAIVFALSCALAATSGSLLGTLFAVDVNMGVPYMLKMFAVVVLAGRGNFAYTIGAAMLIATTENFVVSYYAGQWQDMVTFAVIVLVLSTKYILRRT